MWWDSVLSILDKIMPGRREQYVDALNKLETAYAKALNENRDTDAAVIRKQMNEIRKKLGYAEV